MKKLTLLYDAAFLAFTLVLMMSCIKKDSSSGDTASSDTSTFASNKKSLVIGIDGLGFGKNGFTIAHTPNINSLIDGSWATGYQGAYSGEAFTGGIIGTSTEQKTSSGPGWSTIFTGVWVDRHNVSDNSFSNPDFENNPSYLETLEESIPEIFTASIDSWSEINTYIIPTINDNNSSIDNDTTFWGGDWWTSQYLYNDGATTYYVPVDGRALSTAITFLSELDTNAAANFIHFVSVDWAGHWWGGSSSIGYQKEIEKVDSMVGHLLTTIKNRTNFPFERWQIIVTSDHGHLPDGGHGRQSELERRIPFIVSSKSLNQGIIDSGNGPGISIADVAPTVLDHFALDAPNYYAGVSRANGALSFYQKYINLIKNQLIEFFVETP